MMTLKKCLRAVPSVLIYGCLVMGCKKTNSVAASEPSSKESSPQQAESLKTKPAAEQTDQTAAPKQLKPDLRTAFRAVLKAGYKKASAKAHPPYCRVQYGEFFVDPDHAVAFLKKKLADGRIHEKPLALHLLARLGAKAKSAERYVAPIATRAWDLAFNRCVAKLRGEDFKGVAFVATDAERSQCIETINGSRPPSGLKMACETLRAIGAGSSAHTLLTRGIGGYFAHDCVAFLMMADPDKAQTLTFIANELESRPNSNLVKTVLIKRRAEGIKILAGILEARAKRKDALPVCRIAHIAQAYYERGGSLSKLAKSTVDRLELLAKESKNEQASTVAPSVVKCAQRTLDILSKPPVLTAKVDPPPLETQPATYPFCPDK
ncbi:MAG: hypothetical protein CMH52_07315 [Myxococcales bacterium]|nr:hypothetical protein [Myxococcales bacterium]